MPEQEITYRHYELLLEVGTDEEANRETFRKKWNLLERQVFPELRARDAGKAFRSMLTSLKEDMVAPYTKENASDKDRMYRLFSPIMENIRQEIHDGTETLLEAFELLTYWDTTYAPNYLQACRSLAQS